MKLIVGLGNVGKEYNYTPHNAGFLCLDILKDMYGDPTPWYEEGIFQAMTYKTDIEEVEVVLLKPTTFMNRSGEAVDKYISKKGINPKDVILVHDDLDIPLGKYKIGMGTAPKQHNGVISVERRLKGIDFLRVRIGVDNRNGIDIPGDRYVLKKYDDTEVNILRNICQSICKDIVENYLSK